MRLPTRLTLATVVILCGCNKHNVLEAERSALELKQRSIQEQIDAYDEKIRAISRLGNAFDSRAKKPGPDPKTEIAKTAAKDKIKLWTAHEDHLKELGAKTGAYKAKYLK